MMLLRIGVTALLCGAQIFAATKQIGFIIEKGAKVKGKRYSIDGCVTKVDVAPGEFEIRDGWGKITVVSRGEQPAVADCMWLRGVVEVRSGGQVVIREEQRKGRKSPDAPDNLIRR